MDLGEGHEVSDNRAPPPWGWRWSPRSPPTPFTRPPAGIDPQLVVSLNQPWSFIVVPVLAGALMLGLFAFVWHRFAGRMEWPRKRP